jgi:hypothetical protein
MTRYAANTQVTADRTIAEIQRTVMRFGGDKFAYAMGLDGAQIMFSLRGRVIRFEIKLPAPGEFSKTETGLDRSAESIRKSWEQACRQQYRELAFLIKAKLIATCSKSVADFETEFLGNLVLPDGHSVADVVLDKVKSAYLTGGMPKLLMGGQ